jgi:DNA-directed RNA polymerase specialized sigma24 family protein
MAWPATTGQAVAPGWKQTAHHLYFFLYRLTNDPKKAESIALDAVETAGRQDDRTACYRRAFLAASEEAGEPDLSQVDRLAGLVLQLPWRSRAALLLRHYDRFDDAEIASILRVSRKEASLLVAGSYQRLSAAGR